MKSISNFDTVLKYNCDKIPAKSPTKVTKKCDMDDKFHRWVALEFNGGDTLRPLL